MHKYVAWMLLPLLAACSITHVTHVTDFSSISSMVDVIVTKQVKFVETKPGCYKKVVTYTVVEQTPPDTLMYYRDGQAVAPSNLPSPKAYTASTLQDAMGQYLKHDLDPTVR